MREICYIKYNYLFTTKFILYIYIYFFTRKISQIDIIFRKIKLENMEILFLVELIIHRVSHVLKIIQINFYLFS